MTSFRDPYLLTTSAGGAFNQFPHETLCVRIAAILRLHDSEHVKRPMTPSPPMQDTKPCIACFEPIKRQARKCPNCLQIQTGAAALVNNPWLGWIAAVALVAMLAGLGYLFFSSVVRGTAMPQLEVGPSTLRISSDVTHPQVSCFAQLKNTEIFAVSDPSLQAQFYDASATQIDVHYEKHRFTLFPAVAAGGRVTGVPSGSIADYKSCKVVVLNAR